MNSYGRKLVLEVPFTEKDEAKARGAWWDPEIKKWYVPKGKDPVHFKKWWPEPGEQTQRSAE